MKGTIYIVLKEDMVLYPPVLSIIRILIDLNWNIVFIGYYSDIKQKEELKQKGVIFKDTIKYNIKANFITKYIEQKKFKSQVLKFVSQSYDSSKDYVWIFQDTTVSLLGNSFVKRYRCVLHFFEYVNQKMSWKYKLLSPTFKLKEACKDSYRIVCCEYNRAHILKGLFGLRTLPIILPNKISIEDEILNSPPIDIEKKIECLNNRIRNRKVVLYQGIFIEGERRLDEFVNAVNEMKEDIVLVLMGQGDIYNKYKKIYESDKIIFMDFIRPPYHLLVTKMASVGILTYFPRENSISSVLNPLYCAPNKIFEYSKYGLPMISNDIPALYYTFNEYGCGEVIQYPITSISIIEKLEKIFENYEKYSLGSQKYYNSVDIKDIINGIFEDKN